MNKMENAVKDFKFGEDLKGYREVSFEISSDESEEAKTTENFEKAKSIIETRLSKYNVEAYNIGLDKKTGKIHLLLQENAETDSIVSNLKETGTFEMKDTESSTVLIDRSKVQEAKAMYNTANEGTTVYLRIQLNKEGTEILKDLTSNEYAKIEETTTDENAVSEETENSENENDESTKTEDNTSEENKQKTITLAISGSDVTSTSFEKPIEDGAIDLVFASNSKDSKDIQEYLKSASTIATTLNNGPLPVKYTTTKNQYISTDIKLDSVYKVLIGISFVFVTILVFLVVKYKEKGLLATISFVGFVALYLLLLRYTNVVISLESIVGIILICAINYWFNYETLKIDGKNNKEYNDKYIELLIKMVPVFVISIMFSFVKWSMINTIGMVMIWGIALILLYNRFITKKIVD